MMSKDRKPSNPFERLPDIGITRRKDLPAMFGCSAKTIDNYIRGGILKMVRVGPNVVGASNTDLKNLGKEMVQQSRTAVSIVGEPKEKEGS